MKASSISLICFFSLLSSISYAEDSSDCSHSAALVMWNQNGINPIILCGYTNGHSNSSYIQVTNIPEKTKNACLHIEYMPMDSSSEMTDSLTISPNEGVVLNKVRSPTNLHISAQNGVQSIALPLSTDGVKNDSYGFSISAQSSSVDVKIKINWDHNPNCGDKKLIITSS